MEKRARLRVVLVLAVAATALAGAAQAGRDGNGQIVFQSQRSGNLELYLQNIDGTGVRRLTFNNAQDRVPAFSPDGRRVVFMSNRDGDFDLYILDLDTGTTTQITNDAERDDNPAFTADGAQVVWQRGSFFCPCSIWIVNADGSDPRQLDTGPGNALHPAPAPQGKAIAFSGDRSGTHSIYTLNFAGKAGTVKQVTSGPATLGDVYPAWSNSGRDLVFARDDNGVENDLYVVHQDGSGLRQLTSGARNDAFAEFAPSDDLILFSAFDTAAPNGARLYTIRPDGTDEQRVPEQGSPFVETFDGPGLERTRWWQQLAGPGSAITVTGGRAELSLAADAANDPARGWMGPHFGTECRAVGDYEARYSYTLLDWPFANGTHLLLGDGGVTGSIGRVSTPWFEGYLAFFNPLLATVVRPDPSGALRIARAGSTLTASYSAGSAWASLLSGPTSTAPATVGAHLFSRDDTFGNAPVRVAVDDFTVVADSFQCPAWWRSAAADWQPVPKR